MYHDISLLDCGWDMLLPGALAASARRRALKRIIFKLRQCGMPPALAAPTSARSSAGVGTSNCLSLSLSDFLSHFFSLTAFLSTFFLLSLSLSPLSINISRSSAELKAHRKSSHACICAMTISSMICGHLFFVHVYYFATIETPRVGASGSRFNKQRF